MVRILVDLVTFSSVLVHMYMGAPFNNIVVLTINIDHSSQAVLIYSAHHLLPLLYCLIDAFDVLINFFLIYMSVCFCDTPFHLHLVVCALKSWNVIINTCSLILGSALFILLTIYIYIYICLWGCAHAFSCWTSFITFATHHVPCQGIEIPYHYVMKELYGWHLSLCLSLWDILIPVPL